MRRRRAALLAAAPVALAVAGTAAIAAPGDIALISVSSAGTQGATAAEASAVSADGRSVAFTSASDLAGTATGGVVQLYVRDRSDGKTVLASSSAGGAAANGAVDAEDVGNVLFSISGNGRYVVFASTATNLTPADTDANKDVYRKDLQTGAVDLLSVNSAGQKANAAIFGDPDVSYDGRIVSFGSGTATNLFGADGNAANSDIVVRDLAAGTTVLAARNQAGAQANGTTERSAISADGRVVTFTAVAGTNNLLPGEPAMGDQNDIIVRNLSAGTTAGATDPTRPKGANFSDISGDGRYVVFETGDNYDPVNDTNSANDAYRRDMATGAFALVSAKDGAGGNGNGDGIRPVISADGTRVAFTSTSTDLVAGTDGNLAARDVYTRDVGTSTTRRASARANGVQASTDTDRGAEAANGGLVSMVNSDAGATTKLSDADTNAQPDVFAKELTPSDTTGPTIALAGDVGTVTDPSGIAELTVGGTPAPVGPNGTFPAPVTTTPTTFRAVDGSGNVSQVVRAVPTQPGGPAAALRIRRIKAKLVGRKLTVRFRLDANAKVTVTLLKRKVRTKPRRKIVLTAVSKPVSKTLQAGQRAITLKLKVRPPAGRYVVRVRARALGKTVTATTTLKVAALPKPSRQ